mgnify:CR=1 FL=1
MNRARLIDRLIEHESLRLKPYTDTAGRLTIGIGRNLTDRGITELEARYLAGNDIGIAEVDLDRNVPWWRTLNESRQEVLTEMCYNLGWPKLSRFVLFLEAAEVGDFQTAAAEMLESLWAHQVGNRAVTLADAMRAGTFDLIA